MDNSSRTSFESTTPSTLSASQSDLQGQMPASAIRNPHLRPRRGSTASSVLSFGSAGTALQDMSKVHVGSSSISTLVDNPSSRAVIPRPTTRDIPPVNLSPIPKIKNSEFADYLAIASEYDKYKKAKDQGLEEHIRSTKNEPISPTPSLAEFAGLVTGLGPGSVAESIPKPRKSRRNNLAVTPLSAVPQVYFDENFRLENPRIFDIVSERSDIIRPTSSDQPGGVRQDNSSRKALASNAILQEKLSWYMDTVEVHLISSISTASSTFFAALGDLRELHSEVSDSVQKIHNIRGELARIDEEQALKGLEIIRLRKRRNNVVKLERAVKQMQTVVEGVSKAENLLAETKIGAALDQVDYVEGLMSGNDPSSADGFDLRRVPALEVVETDLAHLRQKIGKAFEKNFVDTLLTDLQEHVNSVSATDTLQRFNQSFSRGMNRQSTSGARMPTYTSIPDLLRNQLKEHLTNLQRAKWITSAIGSYRTTATREVKRQIANLLPVKDDNEPDDNVGVSISSGVRSAWATAVSKLGPLEAEELLINMYTRVSELCRRLSTQQKLLLDLTMNLGETSISGLLSPRLQGGGPDSDMAEAMTTGLSDLIAPVLEVAQSKLVILLRARDEPTSHYASVDFYRYLTLNKNFASECEAVSGRVSSTFLSIVNSQTQAFVKNIHNERRTSLADTLARDKWQPKDFDERSQTILQHIIDAATSDPEWWTRHSRLYEDTRALTEPPQPEINGEIIPREKMKFALIDEQKYVLPGSSLVALEGLERYEESICMIPSMATEIATNLLDYLNVFNGYAKGLILGAGATKSAGLQHITTKHLAIASQSLSFVISLIPYMREFVRRHARNNGNVVTEFEKVRREYQEHQTVIHDKFVTIIRDRLDGHIRTLVNLNWEERVEGDQPNQYIETLVRETSVLSKTLTKHLIPKPTHLFVMDQIFSAYKTKLVEDGFARIELRSEEAKARMLRDVEFLNDKISKMEGSGNTGTIILEAVRNKQVRQRGNGPSSATPNGSS